MWCDGTSDWSPGALPSNLTPAQLEVIAEYEDFEEVIQDIDWSKITLATKLALLQEHLKSQ